MRKMIVISLVSVMAVLLLGGCQESQSNQIQRARLVGHENLQLKKQLEAKDAEIAQLKKAMEKLRTEKDDASKQFGDTNIRVMQIIAETEKKNQQLIKEVEELKAEIKTLKAQ